MVLGILAMLSSVAIRSLGPIADQSRYESTQRLLDELRVAVAGHPARQYVGDSSVIHGVVADTGMLPGDVDDLLTRPVGWIDRTLQSFDSDRDTIDDINLTSGWNGPYMQLGRGRTEIVDGWGHPPALTPNLGGLDLTSTGSDGDSVGSEVGYQADVTVPILAKDFEGDCICRLFDIDSVSGLRIDPSPTAASNWAYCFMASTLLVVAPGRLKNSYFPSQRQAASTFVAVKPCMGPLPCEPFCGMTSTTTTCWTLVKPSSKRATCITYKFIRGRITA